MVISQLLGFFVIGPVTFCTIHIPNTVGGRNPAPVDIGNIQLFTRFYTSQVVSRISEPSTV